MANILYFYVYFEITPGRFMISHHISSDQQIFCKTVRFVLKNKLNLSQWGNRPDLNNKFLKKLYKKSLKDILTNIK